MDPEVLTKAPLFAESTSQRCGAEQAIGSMRLMKGQILFREGETEDRLYVVAAGKIKLGRSGSAAGRTCWPCSAPGRCSASCRSSTPARARARRPR